jgi:hypothetical protein
MKFSTLLALVASASATTNMDLETMALKDQMKSLQSMVKIAETHKAPAMISAISDRKTELEYQIALNDKADKQSVARELQYLLSLVQSIESNDHVQATKVLNQRKNKLIKYQMHLASEEEAAEEPAEEEAAAEEEPAAEEEATEEEPAAEEEATEEEPAAEEEATEEEPATDETTDAADPAVDPAAEPKKGKMMGGIIGGVVVAGLLVGGCVYMRKKNEDAEGGEKEDKKLFKLQFKGNSMKKSKKEALVPTFAIPAEENI